MGIRLIKWSVFSVVFGLLPLSIKTGILYLCGNSINYSDVYSEIVFFDLVLNAGIISEAISLKKYKGIQTFLISLGFLATIVLAVLFTLLLMISYEFSIELDFAKMTLPAIILSCTSVIGSLATQIMLEVER